MNVAVGFEEERELTEFGLWTLLGEKSGDRSPVELCVFWGLLGGVLELSY